MKKNSVLRFCALLIALAIFAASLFACTPGGSGINGLEKVTLDHVYGVKYLETVLDSNSWIQSAMSVGDDTYLTASYYKEIFIPADGTAAEEASDGGTEAAEESEPVEDLEEKKIAVDDVAVGDTDAAVDETEGTYEYENGIRLIKVSPDGTAEKIKDFVNTYESDENAQKATYVNYSALVPTGDGKVWALINDGLDDWSDPQNYVYETRNRIVLLTPDGVEEQSINLQEVLAPTLEQENAGGRNNIYIDRFFFTPENEIIVYGNNGSNLIAILDASGKLLRYSELSDDMWINSFVQLRGGDVVGMSYSYDSTTMSDTRKIVRINTASGELEEIGDMPFAAAYSIFPSGEDGKVFVTNQSALYLYDIASGELKEEVNWLNSDLNANRVTVLAGMPGGGILISENSRNYDSTKLALLTENPSGDTVEKYVVNFASVYLDDNMTEAIISFNKQNDEYRIVYNDYSVYNTEDDYEAGIKQLNNDIIAGKIPDIFSLQGLDFDIYASKGLLYDLNNLMDSDESFNRSDYFENILNATSVGGKLYSIIPNFTIETVIGKTSVVGDGSSWSMEDLERVMQEYPGAAVFGDMTKNDVLRYFMRLSLDKYIDSETYTCYFDTPEFISVLELVNKFPEEINWDEYYSDMGEDDYMDIELQYFENRTLLAYIYLSRFYYPYQARMYGEEVSYIGFPVREGTGSAISPGTELAVSAKSKGIDIAWEFIKYLLSYDYQKDITYSFSTNRRVTEEMAQKALEEADKRRKELENKDENAIVIGRAMPMVEYISDGVMVSTSTAIETPAADSDGTGNDRQDILNSLYGERLITQQDIDKMMALITSVDSVARENAEVEKIITEEAAAYFSGQKSAEEVAKTIQSKVFLYVSESR